MQSSSHEAVEAAIAKFDAAWGPSRAPKLTSTQVSVQYRVSGAASLREACEKVQGVRVFQDIAMPRERGMTDMLLIVDGLADAVSFHVEATRVEDGFAVELIVYQPDESDRGPINAGPIFSSCMRILTRIGNDPAEAIIAFVGWAMRKGSGVLDDGMQRRLLAGLARLVAERIARD